MTSPAAGSRDPDSTIVVLALGAVEQHSAHLPLGTDGFIASEVAFRVAARAGGGVVVAPTLWGGASDHHVAMPGTVSVGTDALAASATAIVLSLARSSGWRRFLLVNGHGGNQPAVRLTIERVRRETEAVQVWGLDYWNAAFDFLDRNGCAHPGKMGHADAIETSVLLAIRPDLVKVSAARADTYQDDIPDWVHTTEGIPERTQGGGVGDPTGASALFGTTFLDAAVEGTFAVVERMRESA